MTICIYYMYVLYIICIFIHTYGVYIYIYIHRFTQQTFFSPLALKKNPTFHSWLVGHIFHRDDDLLPGDDVLPGDVARPRWRWSWGDLRGIDADGTAVVAPSLFDPGRPGESGQIVCLFLWKNRSCLKSLGKDFQETWWFSLKRGILKHKPPFRTWRANRDNVSVGVLFWRDPYPRIFWDLRSGKDFAQLWVVERRDAESRSHEGLSEHVWRLPDRHGDAHLLLLGRHPEAISQCEGHSDRTEWRWLVAIREQGQGAKSKPCQNWSLFTTIFGQCSVFHPSILKIPSN